MILLLYLIISSLLILFWFGCLRYFEKCTAVFPYENCKGFNIMHNEKNRSIVHGGPDIARWADLINMSCEAPETGHKFWIKEPEGCTNQGPKAALTMMNHMLA